jgi:hypothetical protein
MRERERGRIANGWRNNNNDNDEEGISSKT